MNPCFRC